MAKKKKNETNIVEMVKKMAEEAVEKTSQWQANQELWNKMRYRVKKSKTSPFVGCANMRMPTIEIKLRKVKSALVNRVFGIRPVIQAIPTPSGNWETALKVEKFLDHLIMDVMKIKPKAIIGIDQALEKGFYLFKPYWRTEITTRIETVEFNKIDQTKLQSVLNAPSRDEAITLISDEFGIDRSPLVLKHNMAEIEKLFKAYKEQEKEVELEIQDVIYNFPDIALAEPERVFVPTDAGYNPQECPWIIHEFFMPLDQVKQNAKNKGWDIGEVKDIETMRETDDESKSGVNAGRDNTIDSDKALREGISDLKRTNKIKIWEFYGWFDINNDGTPEKCVITIAPDFDKVFRKITLPFASGKYPFVKLYYELCDDRWFSHRGIPEHLEDVVKEIDIQHNQKIDSQTIRNAPVYLYRAGAINKNVMQFGWGQGIAVHGMQPLTDVIAPMNNNNSNVEYSYEREQMILESKIEELIGQPDFTLQSMINRRQPRTLGEVNMQQQNMQQVFSLDAEVFSIAFEELFNWIWELWCEYGDDEYEFSYFGANGFEKIKVNREEIQNKYKITIRGNDQNTNPQIRIQKAQTILMDVTNPQVMQSGTVTPINIANARKLMYQELGQQNFEEYITYPQQQPPPPPPPPNVKINMDELTADEQAQVLSKQGINPDFKNRGIKAAVSEKQKKLELDGMSIENSKALSELLSMDDKEEDLENAAEPY